MTSIKSKGQFDQVTSSALDSKYVVNFWASWAPACEDMNIAFDTLAKEHSQLEFLKVEAEVVPEVTMEYGVEAVPCFLLLKREGELLIEVDRINGAYLDRLKALVIAHTTTTASRDINKRGTNGKEEGLEERLDNLTKKHKMVVFIKGTPEQPKCGFTRTLLGLLRENQLEFDYFDILSDEQVRQGLKAYSDWPTYPQIYINGEFQGGLDIFKEQLANGELQRILA